MITLKPQIPRCIMLDEGHFFIWKELDYGYDPMSFKHMLFGWHAPSYYGTMLESREIKGQQGIILSPLMALNYFSHVAPVQCAVIEWSEEIQLLMRLASLLRETLKHGWYVPDVDQWNKAEFGWKLALPEALTSAADTIWREAERLNVGPIHKWLELIIRDLVQEDELVHEAWNDLRKEQPLLPEYADTRSSARISAWQHEEEEWLISLGLREDPLPFRMALRLTEPQGTERHWKLELVLQDLANPDTLIPIESSSHTLSASVSNTEAMPIPSEWVPRMLERMDKSLAQWASYVPDIMEGVHSKQLRTKLTNDEAWKFLSEHSARLLSEGVLVFLPPWWESLKRNKLRMKAKLKSSVGTAGGSMLGIRQLLDFDWKFAIGDLTLSEEELDELVNQQQRLVRYQDRWIELDPATLARIRAAMNRVRKKQGLSFKDVLEMALQDDSDIWTQEDAYDRDEEQYMRFEIELNEAFRNMLAKLQHKQSLPPVHAPANFAGSLRSYQLEGVSWLLFLRQFGLGGCLADDMGLGKTIQFINYLLVLHNQGELGSPALLICPTSVLGNWQKELERFAPSLRIHIHYGSNRERSEHFLEAVMQHDLILTSYTTAQLDENDLSQLTWSCICLDEAQYIKNIYTKQSAAVRKLEAQHRIALTGTPIENRLTELWSIFDFINPGYLGTLHEFRHRYVLPIERDKDAEAIQHVQRLINPFLLRRVKKDPAIQLDLPEKNEMKVYVPLTVEQGTLYESIIQDMLDKLDRLSPMERRGLILSTLMKLKQVCDLPALLLKDASEGQWTSRSNKVDRLLDMIEELRAEGDRCLIFTQFIGMGEWLQRIIADHTGERVLFLHGGVTKKKRDEMIAEFQDTSVSHSPPVFILSLKAGGIGLNLTAANHVFHFDRWWNPAVENQATDRAFRIGQTRDVQVHKFITLGTLEERIDEMLEQKQGLSDSIVSSGENWITELSTEELRDLFALRRNWAQEE